MKSDESWKFLQNHQILRRNVETSHACMPFRHLDLFWHRKIFPLKILSSQIISVGRDIIWKTFFFSRTNFISTKKLEFEKKMPTTYQIHTASGPNDPRI